MAKYEDILDITEARIEAFKALGTAIHNIVPNRIIALADQNYPTYNTPYLVIDVLSDINLSGGMSQQPLAINTASDGTVSYLYQAMTAIQLDCYLGTAFADLTLIKNRLNNKNLRYKYFTGEGKYGLTDFRNVNKVVFEMDEQKNQQSANMRLTLTWLFAYKDNIESIDTIYGDGKIIDGNNTIHFPINSGETSEGLNITLDQAITSEYPHTT